MPAIQININSLSKELFEWDLFSNANRMCIVTVIISIIYNTKWLLNVLRNQNVQSCLDLETNFVRIILIQREIRAKLVLLFVQYQRHISKYYIFSHIL